WPEMQLERAYCRPRVLVQFAGRRTAITECRQILLKGGNIASFSCHREIGPQADAALRQPVPIEALAGILLAADGNVGMAEHVSRRNLVAADDTLRQRGQRRHLCYREITIAE